MYECVRAYVRACVRASVRVRACVCVRVRACVSACMRGLEVMRKMVNEVLFMQVVRCIVLMGCV